jgi:hypothetical protein
MSQSQHENEAGYWLIEPEASEILLSNPAYHGFAWDLFGWIAQEVSDRLDLASQSIRLEVVEANYQGAYPCLAARHPSGEISEPIASEIENAIQDLLGTTTLLTILQFLSAPKMESEPHAR